MSEDKPEIKDGEYAESPWSRRLSRWVMWMFFLLVGLFVVLNVAIRIPAVQAFGVRQIGQALTGQLGVPVSVGSFYYDFKSKLVIREVFIPDFHGDTILYAGDIQLQLRTGLLALRQSRLQLNDLTICDVILKDSWYEGEEMSDLSRLLKTDTTVRTDTLDVAVKKPFDFSLHALNTSETRFIQVDHRSGKSLEAHLLNGLIDFQGSWHLGRALIIDHIFLDDPSVTLVSGALPTPEKGMQENASALPSQEGVEVRFPLDGLPPMTISDVKVENGRFSLRKRTDGESGRSGRPIEIEGLALHISYLSHQENELHGRLDYLAGQSNIGLELTGASIDHFLFDQRQLAIENFIVETERSSIGDSIRLKYRSMEDWSEFADKVLIDANFEKTSIALRDIVLLNPALAKQAFFRDNADQVLRFSGLVNGRVNNLRLRDFILTMGDLVRIRGDISSRNLTVRGEEILNMRITDLRTSMASLNSLGFNLPPNFSKLGQLEFKGRFDGYFQDFVAYGGLSTGIGSADLDMRLDLKQGMEKASYSGAMKLIDFDLGKWSGNADLGKVFLSAYVKNGQGLRAQTASADLSANIASLGFKGYTYKNLQFAGKLNSRLLDGRMQLEDPYLNFLFNGKVDFSEELTRVDFSLELGKLDLLPLGLSRRDLSFSTRISLQGQGRTIDDATGLLVVDQLEIKEGDELHLLDSLLVSQNFVNEEKQLILRSPWISGEVNGQYSFGRLPAQVMQLWQKANPQLWQNLKLESTVPNVPDSVNHFSYDLRIKEATDIFALVALKGWSLQNARLRGAFHGKKSTWDVNADFPSIGFPGGDLKGVHLSTDFFDEKTDLYLDIDTIRNGNIELTRSKIYAGVAKDSAILDLAIRDSLYSLDFFESRISLAARDTLFAAHVLEDDIQIDGEKWAFSEDNELVFGKNYFYTHNLYIRSGKKEIGLFPMGKTGIVLDIVSFSGSLINLALNDPKWQFDGELSGQFRLNHIFRKEGFSGDLTLEPFIVNGDDHGILMVSAEGLDFKSQIETEVKIFRPGGKIEAEGWFDLGENADPQRIFYFDIGVFTFPMVVLDYLIPEGISNTTGAFSGRLSFFGGKDRFMQLLGELELVNAETTIDFLQTRYSFDGQRIVFRPAMIDFTGAQMTDILGNKANVSGGLNHKNMRDFSLNARIQSDNFLFLDTKKDDNSDYYGRGIGKADVRFTGDFINPNIYVNAVTAPGTRFVIPVDDEIGDVSNSFVRFVRKDSSRQYLVEDLQSANITGLNFSMDLEVKDEAEVKIIFDEAQGNIMEGFGRGNIQLNITRNGEFSVRGDYEIEKGNYLFTLMNFVNKPFSVRRGGIIRWTGDPLDAQIDIQADYVGLRTSLTNFLSEYGLTGQLLVDAQRATDVLLTMRLTGSLLRPSIDFSLAFPEVPETLRSYVDSKVRNLNSNKEQMNTQVFGLIVFRSFLPSNDVSGGILGNTVGSTVGTISEMLANQFSNMISALLSDAVDSWDVVSGVEFNIDYNQPTGSPQGNNDFRFGEVAVSQSVRLLNDKWVVTLGANYGNNYLANTRYFSPQVELSWRTPVEGLNLQIYYRTEQFFTGLKQKAGVGLRFHKEYDSFLGLKKGVEELEKAQGEVN